jgi:hypothetical protein
MTIDLKVGDKEIKAVTNETGLALALETSGINQDDVFRIVGRNFFNELTEFSPEKESLEAITRAYLALSLVSYETGWRFKDVVRCSMAKLHQGFYEVKTVDDLGKPSTKVTRFLDYHSSEGDFDYFKRVMGKLDNLDDINELTKNAINCYSILTKKR